MTDGLIPQPVYPIKRRRLLALRQRGIVKHGIHIITHLAAKGHNRLPNVNLFAGALANDVHAQQLARLIMENELKQASGVANDLPARDLAVLRLAHLVRHARLG